MQQNAIITKFLNELTHFPYSSLLNFGRVELRSFTNGFNSCEFLCVSTDLLNIATFDESGES